VTKRKERRNKRRNGEKLVKEERVKMGERRLSSLSLFLRERRTNKVKERVTRETSLRSISYN